MSDEIDIRIDGARIVDRGKAFAVLQPDGRAYQLSIAPEALSDLRAALPAGTAVIESWEGLGLARRHGDLAVQLDVASVDELKPILPLGCGTREVKGGAVAAATLLCSSGGPNAGSCSATCIGGGECSVGCTSGYACCDKVECKCQCCNEAKVCTAL